MIFKNEKYLVNPCYKCGAVSGQPCQAVGFYRLKHNRPNLEIVHKERKSIFVDPSFPHFNRKQLLSDINSAVGLLCQFNAMRRQAITEKQWLEYCRLYRTYK
jgi:hypothetical protein